jgi:hypothetical protein
MFWAVLRNWYDWAYPALVYLVETLAQASPHQTICIQSRLIPFGGTRCPPVPPTFSRRHGEELQTGVYGTHAPVAGSCFDILDVHLATDWVSHWECVVGVGNPVQSPQGYPRCGLAMDTAANADESTVCVGLKRLQGPPASHHARQHAARRRLDLSLLQWTTTVCPQSPVPESFRDIPRKARQSIKQLSRIANCGVGVI